VRGVVVTGELALVNARVVEFLRALRTRYGAVLAAPTSASLAPVVDVPALRYTLGQLLRGRLEIEFPGQQG
jgi:hypothetical protein